MKKVLSLLLAYVFLQTQLWAISGGPFENTGGRASVVGTYAGVLVPEAVLFDPTPRIPPRVRAVSIGLFTMAQPQTGLASGNLVIFVDGAAFRGTVDGLIDPATGQFNGIIDGSSVFEIVTVVGTTTIRSRLSASGSVEARVRSRGSTPGFSAARIVGTAIVDTFGTVDRDGSPIVTSTTSYTVNGFRQSDTASTSTGTGGRPGGGAGGGGGGRP